MYKRQVSLSPQDTATSYSFSSSQRTSLFYSETSIAGDAPEFLYFLNEIEGKVVDISHPRYKVFPGVNEDYNGHILTMMENRHNEDDKKLWLLRSDGSRIDEDCQEDVDLIFWNDEDVIMGEEPTSLTQEIYLGGAINVQDDQPYRFKYIKSFEMTPHAVIENGASVEVSASDCSN